MTRRKAPHEKLRPGPKPGAGRAAAEASAAQATPASVAAPSRDPLQRHRNIQLMGEEELRAYALQIGVLPRDAQGLAVDRLRQNCVHTLNALIENL